MYIYWYRYTRNNIIVVGVVNINCFDFELQPLFHKLSVYTKTNNVAIGLMIKCCRVDDELSTLCSTHYTKVLSILDKSDILNLLIICTESPYF